MLHQFLNDVRNCFFLNINFRFSQTNNFSQVIYFQVLGGKTWCKYLYVKIHFLFNFDLVYGMFINGVKIIGIFNNFDVMIVFDLITIICNARKELLSYDAAVIQWITSYLKNRMTTRVITRWRLDVTSLTTSVSTMGFLAEIILILW